VVVDFDEHDPSPPLAFLQRARHYGIEVGLEASKSKGYHLWVFADPPGVPASKARLLARAILRDIGKPDTEVFPKQDRIEDGASYGNFINAPLFGALVPKGRTVFVDPDNGLRPFRDQWEFLECIRRTPESLFDEVLKRCRLPVPAADAMAVRQPTASGASHRAFGLPPCAQRMLAGGVAHHQRVACFRLAGHLRKAGIPEDAALAALMAWAAKNHPPNGKGIITRAEIYEQTRCAFGKQYRSCGCEEPAVAPYCNPSCPLRRRNPTAPGQGGHQAVPPGSPAARQR